MTNKTNILKTARDEGIVLTNGSMQIMWSGNNRFFIDLDTGIGLNGAELSLHHWQPYIPPKSKQDELEEAWEKWTCVSEDIDGSKLNILLACLIERLGELEK